MKAFLPISWQFCIETDLLSFHIEQTEGKKFFIRSKKGASVLYCPLESFSEKPDFQRWLRQVICEMLRKQAKMIFPERLQAWSERSGLKYKSLFIHETMSKWGSYSSLKNLNLSLYLLLLDSRYVDYVMCHELCHSREMNHSSRFWTLLQSVYGSDARQRGKEMNKLVKSWYESGDARYALLINTKL